MPKFNLFTALIEWAKSTFNVEVNPEASEPEALDSIKGAAESMLSDLNGKLSTFEQNAKELESQKGKLTELQASMDTMSKQLQEAKEELAKQKVESEKQKTDSEDQIAKLKEAVTAQMAGGEQGRTTDHAIPMGGGAKKRITVQGWARAEDEIVKTSIHS